MLCDLHRYELSARGPLRGSNVGPLIDAIGRLPKESVVLLDLDQVPWIDARAAESLRATIWARQAEGVEITISAGSLAATALERVGLRVPASAPANELRMTTSHGSAT